MSNPKPTPRKTKYDAEQLLKLALSADSGNRAKFVQEQVGICRMQLFRVLKNRYGTGSFKDLIQMLERGEIAKPPGPQFVVKSKQTSGLPTSQVLPLGKLFDYGTRKYYGDPN